MPQRPSKSACLIALCLIATTAFAAPKPPEVRPVQTANGRVLGILTADQKVIAYKGIPYAQPPIEELRWKPPMPINRWKGVLNARDFGSHCIQFGGYPDMVFHDPGPSEDCLTLNVWVPADIKLDRKSPGLPVMVWIYGGGFTTGGTSENRQDGQFLARHGVIVVSMNYRLGLFGFLALPELTTESDHHTSGNYGLMDQAAALAWVKRNIEDFGGDPANVTIFGESAGSFSVSAQMASPLTTGFFTKAIGESGAAFPGSDLPFEPREKAEQTDAAWAEHAFGSSKLFYLRQIPTDEIVKSAMTKTAPPFHPVIDGFFLPDTVANIYADGKQAHIPVLGGWNANERPSPQALSAESFTAQATQAFGADARDFLAAYPAHADAEAVRAAGDYAGDRFIAYSTWAWLEAHAQTGHAQLHRYFFDLPSPGDRNHSASLGAFHSDDIEYVFGTLDSRPGMHVRPEDRILSDRMQQYWTNFAKSTTGDPNGPGLPPWPTYTAESAWQVMHLDATPEARPDTLRPRYLFLDKLWNKPANPQ